jgi:hypothetical protein
MMERLSATEAAPTLVRAESALVASERAIREADPWAFPVASRIVRRVIRHEFDLPAFIARVPHRKSVHLAADRARQIVANDELGLENGQPLPETVILLARPEEHELEAMTAATLREHMRRLHFHARVHVALDERLGAGALDQSAVRERIERIGYTTFDEARTVLAQEAFLLPPADVVSEYVEFAAVFLELRYFAPDVLSSYFPSLDDIDRVEEIVGEDVDADAILEMTAELAGDEAPRPASPNGERTERRPAKARRVPRLPRNYEKLLRHAEWATKRGNDVRAAILNARAAESPDPALAMRAAALAAADVRRLAQRLRRALKSEESGPDPWRDLLAALLEKSTSGFWNPSARLLYDLQKVCLDSERESYVVDLLSWLVSFGRRPLKRPLPAQREVLVSKHLRIATSRVAKISISAGEREHLGILLRAAAVAAEQRLRERLRPPLEETLNEVGFVPQNLPERVSFRKMMEELLDAVVERGFFAMGDIRDAIARNNLKLDDVADPLELVAGDRLLRADRRLADVLDGVYQRGAIYLRGLQRLSSCAFGTKAGRSLTLYAAIPFGGAYVILAFVDHLAEAARHLARWWSGTSVAHEVPPSHPNLLLTVALGCLLLGLIHVPQMRSGIWLALRFLGRGLRLLFYEVPKWLAEVTFINRLLRSPAFVFFRKRLLTSLVLTGLFCWLFPAVGWYQLPRPSVTALIFVVLAAVLNSRLGRDLEELAAERLQLLWHRIRVHFFVALFDLVMDFFKHVLEGLERVLYEVDEWLRFKSGETELTLRIKAVLGLPWAIVRFVVGFLVTVLVEPQINPIKHFPVVTVSHKVILPMEPMLAAPLGPVFGNVLANTIAGVTVLLLPGVVGFLVWELRGNWRLYAVNRHRELRPVIIGSHGETLVRLMKPGIHSGTIPRLFGRLRRAARRATATRRLRGLMGYYAKLHHLELDVRRFFEREFLGFLTESTAFYGVRFEVGRTELGTNSVRVEIRAPRLGDEPLWIGFVELSGRVVAGVWRVGWTRNLTVPQRSVLAGLLAGFYRVGGVDLVREQIEACLGKEARPYDVTDRGLTLRPGSARREEVIYDLDAVPQIVPRVEGVLSTTTYPTVDAESLVFGRTPTLWNDWVAAWSHDDAGEPFPVLLPLKAHPVSFAPPPAADRIENR